MTVIDTPEGIRIARLMALKGALKLEMKGMRRSRGRSAYSILKEMGYKGSREEVLRQVEREVALCMPD